MVADRLKEIRKKMGITQSEAAKMLDIELRTYQYYESGKYEPSASTIRKLSEVFGVSSDYLLELPENRSHIRTNISAK